MEEHVLYEFPVDLTREEYMAYHDLSARTVGPLRGLKGRTVLSLVLAGLMLALLGFQWFRYAYLDLPMAVLGVGLLVLAVYTGVVTPRRLRRQAVQQYDDAVAAGHCYYGMVTLTADSITKEGAQITATLPLDATTLFIENEQMMVFVNRRGRSIVLPARCMTFAHAAAVRQVAHRRLPPMNRRFLARLQPQEQVPTPTEAAPTVTLMEGRITYTEQEMISLIRGRTLAMFSTRLPSFGGISLVAGILYGWGMESPVTAMVVFAGCLGLLTLFTLVLPYFRSVRAARMVQVSTGYTITDRGIRLQEGSHELSLPWSAVRHVYDRGDYAEMQFRHGGSFRLPKRELADVAAFEAILQQYWHNKE